MENISNTNYYPALDSLEIGTELEIEPNPDYPKFSNSTAIKYDECMIVSVIRETEYCFENIEPTIKAQKLLEYAAEMETAIRLTNSYDMSYVEEPLEFISNKQIEFTFALFVDDITTIVDYLDNFYHEYEDEMNLAYESLCIEYGLDLEN